MDSEEGARVNANVAPYPYELEGLVSRLRYRAEEGWRFSLDNVDRGQGSKGLTLTVLRRGPDSYHPERIIRVNHFFPVPPAAYDVRSWRRWLFDQVRLVELHELMENFKFVTDQYKDDEHYTRPYAPSHGPGNDPYLIREVGTEEDQRTSFRGVLKEAAYDGDSKLTPGLRRQTNESRKLNELIGQDGPDNEPRDRRS